MWVRQYEWQLGSKDFCNNHGNNDISLSPPPSLSIPLSISLSLSPFHYFFLLLFPAWRWGFEAHWSSLSRTAYTQPANMFSKSTFHGCLYRVKACQWLAATQEHWSILGVLRGWGRAVRAGAVLLLCRPPQSAAHDEGNMEVKVQVTYLQDWMDVKLLPECWTEMSVVMWRGKWCRDFVYRP